MMKKLLSLLLVLMLLLPGLPVPEAAASSQNEVLQYGTVDAAMDAYAKKALRPYQSKFSAMTSEGVLAFRTSVDEVYGRENHDDEPNWLMENLVTLGFTVTENDNVWLLSKNQIQLDLKYLLMLAQMDVMPFEDAVKQVQTYMPEYNLGAATLGLAADVFVNLLGAKLGDMVKADALMYAPEFLTASKKLSTGGFFSKTLSKALDFTIIKYGDIYSTAASLSEAAKSLSAYTADDPALLNLVSSYNQALSGASLLTAMQSGGITDPELAESCRMLSNAYTAFLNELDGMGNDELLHQKLQNENFLSDRFDSILASELNDYIAGTDVLTSAAAGALTIIDVWQGGWGNLILKGGANVVGEALFGTNSTYTHFHAMLTLDRMYAALEAATQSGGSWKEQAAYARNIQRLCSIALLGETHVYQLASEDLKAGQKLWLMLKYDASAEDVVAQNLAWYNQRVEFLHGVYNAAQEYLDTLYEHYDKLCQEASDMAGLWGYSHELTSTFSGVVTEDKWFALPDGSGPDKENPNPIADEPVEGLKVSLMAGDKVIASGTTNAEGRYTLTYPLYLVKGRELSLTMGEEDSDDYALKEDVSSPSYRATAFRSSYRWNPDTETLAEQSAAESTFHLPYADDYFLAPSLDYNHNLALASLGLSAAAMSDPDADSAWTAEGSVGRDGNIRAAWASLGFSVAVSSGYDENLNAISDEPAYTIATKTFSDPDAREDEPENYRVVGVAIRGDVDAAELAHTLMAAGEDSSYARSVRSAAMDILSQLERIVASGYNEKVPTKVWITGFSRGGAIAGQLSDLVRLRSSLNAQISGLYTYTFGAPGGSKGGYSAATSSSGIFNIVYEEDWIATGLLHTLHYDYKAPGQSLEFGKAQAGTGRYRIASAFHDLTDGNSPYDPLNYTADATLRAYLSELDESKSDTLYIKELQPLVTAILQASFLRGDTGRDFRTLSLQDKHEQAAAITGINQVVLDSTSTADDTLTTSSIDAILEQAFNGSTATFFAALPADMQDNLRTYLGDVLRLAAKNSGEGSAFTLSEDMAEMLLPLVLTLSDDFSNPTSLYSSLYSHHPEIYMAWMMGLSGTALFDKKNPDVFNTPVLPYDKNLFGTVVDDESGKPLAGVPVLIQGGYGEDAVNRTFYTDEEGKWATFVKPADYTVTFNLPGYEEKVETIYQSQLEVERVELLTGLVALNHDSIIITTTTRKETAEHASVTIIHPHVYSEANPALTGIVEQTIGSIFSEVHERADRTLRNAHTCRSTMYAAHTEHAYMTHVYATDTLLCMNISYGYLVCSIGHQCTTTRGYTFDVATGKLLTLDDLLDPANPNAKQGFLDAMTKASNEAGYSSINKVSRMYNLANKYDLNSNWYLLNDGIYMDFEFISSGYQGIFVPYADLAGVLKPECLPVENIGASQTKPVRIENVLDDYDGQLIYGDDGNSCGTGIQLDGLTTHIWVDDRIYGDENVARGRYFYGYKVKDVTVMLPDNGNSSWGVVWTDWQGDHFATCQNLPEPEPEETDSPIDLAP